ncbi:MAG: hypothetical protein NC393_03730 [Clostridium sp.]|nr:hypothetical protein [Clostridium sp.]MCM1208884.1 hypothetical protein [Ruminococcus sp.]
MRITSQMLSENMGKAGVSLQHHSLLDYMRDENASSSLFNVMNTKAGAAVSSVKLGKYEDLSKAADKLISYADKLSDNKKDSVMSKAKESGDTSELYKNAEALVESYNDMLSAMKFTPGTLNTFYRNSLNELTEENKEELAELGITVESNGALSIDKSKFNSASMEKLEKMFGGSNSFLEKLSYTAAHIGDNAEANLDNSSSSYLPGGKTASGYKSKYDYKG